jgi:hypothetical protein
VFSDSVATNKERIEHIANLMRFVRVPFLAPTMPDTYFLFPSRDAANAVKSGESAYNAYYNAVGRLLRKAVDQAGWPLTRPRFTDSVRRVSNSGFGATVKVGFDAYGANECAAFHSFKLEANNTLTHVDKCPGDREELRKECAPDPTGLQADPAQALAPR